MRVRMAAVVGVATIVVCGIGAVAYAARDTDVLSPTESGNEMPIDDNHGPASPAATQAATRAAAPSGPSHGEGRATPPVVAPASPSGGEPEPGDDRSPAAVDRHGGDAGAVTRPPGPEGASGRPVPFPSASASATPGASTPSQPDEHGGHDRSAGGRRRG